MRDRDLERRLDDELARVVDRTDRFVSTPDVEVIHGRAESRTVRGIAATCAVTTVAGLLLGAVVIGVGGIGMNETPQARRAAPSAGPTAGGSAGTAPGTVAPPPEAGPQGTVAPPRTPDRPSSAPPVPTTDAVPSTAPATSPVTVPDPARTPYATPTPRPSGASSPPPTVVPPPARPSPRPSSSRGATTVPRAPLVLRLDLRSGAVDGSGCRRSRLVDRTLTRPTPRSVVGAVLDGPTAAERDAGARSVYGRGGQATPATVTVDWARRVVTVDLALLGDVGISPAPCRGREIWGPVREALRQYDPAWSLRMTAGGSQSRFHDYVWGP